LDFAKSSYTVLAVPNKYFIMVNEQVSYKESSKLFAALRKNGDKSCFGWE